MPACPEVRDLLEPWLDGELDAEAQERIDAHLQDCSECAPQVAVAREVRAALAELPVVACPDPVRARVLEHAAAASSEPQRGNVLRFFRRSGSPPSQGAWALVAATVAALALAVAFLAPDRFTRSNPDAVEIAGMTDPIEGGFSPEELEKAEQDARLALAVLGSIGQRAAVALRDDVLRPRVVEAPLRALAHVRGLEAGAQ